jgi:hypothetical protein
MMWPRGSLGSGRGTTMRSVGRWTSKDYILFGDRSITLFGYSSNDPINVRDPSGRSPLSSYDWCIAITAALGISANSCGPSPYRDPSKPPWSPPSPGTKWAECLALPTQSTDRGWCCDDACEQYGIMHPGFDESACKQGCNEAPQSDPVPACLPLGVLEGAEAAAF